MVRASRPPAAARLWSLAVLALAALVVLVTFSFMKLAGPWESSTPLPETGAAAAASRVSLPAPARQYVLDASAKLPLAFIANAGQLDPRVRFYSQGSGYGFYFRPEKAVFSFFEAAVRDEPSTSIRPRSVASSEATRARGVALELRFIEANPDVVVEGRERTPTVVNYLRGSDPAKWHTGLASYEQIVYRELWPGIDMAVRGLAGKLKYEFVLRPGARVEDIRLAYRGSQGLAIDGWGDLLIATPLGVLLDSRPVTHQLIDGRRVAVDSRYVLRDEAEGKGYGFAVGAGYDPAHPLVIDPGLVYSTFLGGSRGEVIDALALDEAGNVYVAGSTFSADFPITPGAFDPTFNGPRFYSDIFVTKLDAAGSALVYSTYLGGERNDSPSRLVLDAAGNAYLRGETVSPDFPTTPGAFDRSFSGINDVFVTKLDASGSALVYSTFLGGDTFESGSGLAVDAAGNAYVTGGTNSEDFPTTPGVFDRKFDDLSEAFVTKLDPTGSSLVYSTFLKGHGRGLAIATDAAGNAYIAGETTDFNFPTTPGAFDRTMGGGGDAFITKLNPNGSALVYSTFLGGSSFETPSDLALDETGNAHVTGTTVSPHFPTTSGAFDPTFNGGFQPDVFITKLNAAGSALVYSTFLGTPDEEGRPPGLALDADGNAYVASATMSPDFPLTASAFDGTFNGSHDAFVSKLDASGSFLLYSTFLGGADFDVAFALALDVAGNAYVAGVTHSSDFPTTPGAFDVVFDRPEGFVSKIHVVPEAAVCGGQPATLIGTNGEDVLLGTDRNDVILGLGGDDQIDGGGGTDHICGGGGDDVLMAGRGDDKLLGEAGRDQLFGEEGQDLLDGGVGDDALDGGPNNDSLRGRGGDDRLDGGANFDSCDDVEPGDEVVNCESLGS